MGANEQFIKNEAYQETPHALLGKLIASMSSTEAMMLLETAASTYPSTVAQSIIRDALNRVRIQSALIHSAP